MNRIANDSLDDEFAWVGPSSPRSSDELMALAPEDLVEFLRSWRPKSGWRESSPEGLGRVLTEAVTKDPIHVAEEARLFRGLEATYVRSLLRGLEGALKSEKRFQWSGVLALCESVVAQPREDERGRNDWNRDPGWSWSRKAVASLTAKGMDSESNRIPSKPVSRSGDLEPVTWDSDPSVERDADRGDEDPFQVAINSVRGEGMIAAIRYAVWIDRHARETTNNAPGMVGMPEINGLYPNISTSIGTVARGSVDWAKRSQHSIGWTLDGRPITSSASSCCLLIQLRRVALGRRIFGSAVRSTTCSRCSSRSIGAPLTVWILKRV